MTPFPDADSRTVVAEGEIKTPVSGVYVGFTMYATAADAFEVVVRNRTYAGCRVASKWDTAPIALEAITKDEALVEAKSHVATMWRTLRAEPSKPEDPQ